MSNDDVLRVGKIANGYEVEICDPAIVAENAKPKGSYKSPWVEYAFKDAEEVLAFIKLHLDSLKPEPDEESQYGAEFARQASKADGETE